MPLGETFPAVLDAARLGESWAWEALYRDLAGQLLGYLRGQGAHEPEDLLGDVWVQLARNLDRFTGDESGFRSWVFTVAHHRIVDERRRRSRRPVASLEELGAIPESAHHSDAETDALVRVGAAEVHDLLADLTPEQRDVLLLRLFADLTIAQIAALTGRRVGAVKALQRRALAALSDRLEARTPSRPPVGNGE